MADLWGTEKLELGTITEPVLAAFSKDFSSAVSTKGVFWDAIGMVRDQNGALTPRRSQTRRFIVPFRPNLAVSLHPSRMVKGDGPFTGSFEGVTVTIFWRGIG